MCIRDRGISDWVPLPLSGPRLLHACKRAIEWMHARRIQACLLYTSDAADERSSVDLGGSRILKKKTTPPHPPHMCHLDAT